MTEAPLIQRERALLHDLQELVAGRASAEVRTEQGFQARNAAAKAEFEQTRERIIEQYETDRESLGREFQAARQRIVDRSMADAGAAKRQFEDTRRKLAGDYEAIKQKVIGELQESRWTNTAIYEAGKTGAERQHKDIQQRATAAVQRIQALGEEARQLALPWDPEVDQLPAPDAPAAKPQENDPARMLPECLSHAEAGCDQIEDLLLPKILRRVRFAAILLGAWLLLSVPALMVGEWRYHWLAGSALGVVLFGILLRFLLTSLATKQVIGLYLPLRQTLAEAETLCQRWREQATANYNRLRRELKVRRDTDLRQAQDKFRRQRADLKLRRKTELTRAIERYRRLRTEIKERRETGLRDTLEKYRRLRDARKQRYDADLHEVHDRYYRLADDSKLQYEQDWEAQVTSWREGMLRIHAAIEEIHGDSSRLFPGWNDPIWQDWVPPSAIPGALRFGELEVSMSQIPNGIPADERLHVPVPATFALPAFLSFPRHCALLLKASDTGRARAVDTLQTLMLRFLTAVPPGKVRFTVIDPVGLGENFATFMHLADYDEALISSKIWTETQHIEQRLTDLTAHMEVVIQKYLRNQYETIEEYNAQAGEVAEPFRILVVANFPANFNSEAARRLVSIVSSGSRCGVYTLVSVDTKQPLPQGFNLQDLEQHSLNLVCKDARFVWKDNDFARLPLTLDMPPDADFATRVLHIVGARAKEASRVEVPFDFIAPTPDQWWTSDSRTGINVPLGRAGATKRQHLRLGHGTSQHVLIAGKTGSGKSTLLHALITNLALLYKPEEVELYLIDFKKGVEFKTYATEELPHARVIAIESEREFGLSVLQRLDAELKHRGERFRAAGVQDLNSYRQLNGSAPLPRIMLIVDEFQEFFVDDDKIAQEAAQLLDRLVRQGRAFGLHILLGSQTLGGAYTLARSTIDQMAVRIALQCSETDAHLILSEDNSAARLLSRPGEAIYNDANGLVEGNNPFQVVWLDDDRREGYLRQIRQLTAQRDPQAATYPQIIFEGNAPADVHKNHLLTDLLLAPTWPDTPRSVQAWLGEAMAIKDPTAALFRAQSGNNLLIVGQYEDAALGLLATALVSLAAQHAPNHNGGARFYVLDGSPVDSAQEGYFARLAAVLPHPVQVVPWRDVSAAINDVAEEVERRQKSPDGEMAPIFMIIYGMQRFRDLRKQEDDFGFGRRGEERPNSARQFSTILREGAALAVHTLLWCDSLNNLQRALDRQAMREFEMRVLFQMSVADSSNLIDTPQASKLGIHRALYYSEEQGRLEKFRPYGVPTDDWLAWVKEQLARKQSTVKA